MELAAERGAQAAPQTRQVTGQRLRGRYRFPQHAWAGPRRDPGAQRRIRLWRTGFSTGWCTTRIASSCAATRCAKSAANAELHLAKGCGNAGPWKAWKTKTRFSTLPTALGNLAHFARFPHFHSPDDEYTY